MGVFEIHDAYPTPPDGSMVESDDEQAGFDIDSDASDTKLLELKQELTRLGPEARWKRYCNFVRKDHLKLLKSRSIMAFKGYLIWYHKTHPRAQRLNTYESVWKALRQLYYDTCQKAVAGDVGKEITNYFHVHFCDERGLIGGMKEKHVVGYNGLQGALYYHWKYDTEIYALELERATESAGTLSLGCTGARPDAFFESG